MVLSLRNFGVTGLTVFLVLMLSGAALEQTFAQEKYALLIGIDKYIYEDEAVIARLGDRDAVPNRRWSNLNGAVNDAKNMKELLVSRFAFNRDNIVTVFDEEATRENIMAAIEEYVINKPQPGDNVFFFYAGHGSQVPNSLSDELNRMDETLVPTDAFFGADDIRDKELRALFNRALDRDIRLTMVFDSCHSGSITRGVPGGIAERKIEPATYDVADGSLNDLPSPEERGALVLSSARDEQTAKERLNPQTRSVTGIFSDALIRVLRESAPNEPVSRIMTRVHALVSSSIADQDPVLAGNEERINASFFGDAGEADGAVYAAVLQKAGSMLVLQGGRAIGLNEGAVLRHHTAGDEPVEVEVTKLEQLTQAITRVAKGDPATVQVGDLFEVVSYGLSSDRFFSVYMPPAVGSGDELLALARNAYGEAFDAGVRWVTNPTTETDAFSYVYPHDGGWMSEAYGYEPVSGTISEVVTNRPDREFPVFMHLPPVRDLYEGFDFVSDTLNIIQLTENRAAADYILTGIYNPERDQIEYSWIRPNASSDDRSVYPARTDPVALGSVNQVRDLNRQINSISRIKGWFDLEGPSGSKFPFRLGFRDKETGELIEAEHLDPGDYEVVLINTMGSHPPEFDMHHVYVFFADNTGRIGLMYPRTSSSSMMPTPEMVNSDEGIPEVHKLMDLPVYEPFAMNAVFMLTSKTPIGNHLSVFNQEPVVGSRTMTRGNITLESLVSNRNTGTRTFGSAPVVDWSLSRVIISSGRKF